MKPAITACHICDALIRDRRPGPGERVRCPRCHALLRRGRTDMLDWLLAGAFSVPPLMAVGLAASFLSLSGGGVGAEASAMDAARALAEVLTWPAALAIGAVIAFLPVARSAALIYALLPVRMGRPPPSHAAQAIRLAASLRPWSMSEIFVIGVAVALVKVSGLASVTLGPAFWAFVMLAVVALVEDAVYCRRTVWDAVG